MENIAIIIPTFNRKDTLHRLLDSLNNQTCKDFTLIVVIDGSTDGTIEMLENSHPEIHTVIGNGDWWWTKSINEGLKYAQSINLSTFLLMNDDTYVAEDFISKLISAYNEVNHGILGTISINQADHKIFDAGILKNNWTTAKLYRYFNRNKTYNNDEIYGNHPTVFLAGRGMLLNNEVINSVGYFDEISFPQYLADYDYAHKVYLSNLPCNITWDAPVFSYIEMTSSGNVNEKSFKKLFLSFFNEKSKQSIKKNYIFYKRYSKYLYPISLIFHYSRTFASFFINKIKSN